MDAARVGRGASVRKLRGTAVMSSAVDVEAIYKRRFTPDLTSRQQMWQARCKGFFQRFVADNATVLEVGAGYCEFINTIRAGAKIAVDLNPDTRHYANPDTRVVETTSTDLSAIESGTIDVAFASNFFEHLTRGDIRDTMRDAAPALRPRGRFLILQPTIRFCSRDFLMFFDHITPSAQYRLAQPVESSGFPI